MLHRLLQRFYVRVYPIARALEKNNDGRIDILVDEDVDQNAARDLKKDLGARNGLQIGPTISLAIPLAANNQMEYFQLDVHVCKPGFFDWQKTLYTHAEMWCIIATCAKHLGFSINETGLYLQVREIEKTHRQDCLLHLTSDPENMMLFLDLDDIRFAIGFESLVELFVWATTSNVLQWRYCNLEDPTSLFERPMRRAFRTEWLPRLYPDVDTGPPESDSQSERRSLAEKALTFFNKRDDCNEKILDHKLRTDILWKQIAKSLPLEHEELHHAMTALMTLMQWRDGEIVLRPKKHPYDGVPWFGDSGEDGERFVRDVVVPWVLNSWREAVELYDNLRLNSFYSS